MKRTQLVCLHEGKRDSIDRVFANSFLKAYRPNWIRPWGSNVARFIACGGKTELMKRFLEEVNICRSMGSSTALIVLADVDDNLPPILTLTLTPWRFVINLILPVTLIDIAKSSSCLDFCTIKSLAFARWNFIPPFV